MGYISDITFEALTPQETEAQVIRWCGARSAAAVCSVRTLGELCKEAAVVHYILEVQLTGQRRTAVFSITSYSPYYLMQRKALTLFLVSRRELSRRAKDKAANTRGRAAVQILSALTILCSSLSAPVAHTARVRARRWPLRRA